MSCIGMSQRKSIATSCASGKTTAKQRNMIWIDRNATGPAEVAEVESALDSEMTEKSRT